MSLHKNVTADEVKSFSAESDGDELTTGTGFLEKLKLTFTAEAADYNIWYIVEIRSTHAQAKVNLRVQLDDAAQALAENDRNPTPLNGYGIFCGFKKVTLTAASHDIDIDFSSSQLGKAVHVRRARLVAMKITQ